MVLRCKGVIVVHLRGLVERHDGLDFFVTVVDERKLSVEQGHLRIECFKIGGGVAMLEEKLRVVVCLLELHDLSLGNFGGLASGVVGIECIAHFLSGLE